MTKRREILKCLTVAGAAGAVWKKPVVDSVMLPAHAATSCDECFSYTLGAGQAKLNEDTPALLTPTTAQVDFSNSVCEDFFAGFIADAILADDEGEALENISCGAVDEYVNGCGQSLWVCRPEQPD